MDFENFLQNLAGAGIFTLVGATGYLLVAILLVRSWGPLSGSTSQELPNRVVLAALLIGLAIVVAAGLG